MRFILPPCLPAVARQILLFAGVVLLAGGASPLWYRFQAGTWEFYTDGGDRRGEQLLRQLAEAHAALLAAAPELASVPAAPRRPLRVMLFRSGRDFAPFRRGEAHRGLYLSGVRNDWILLPDSGGETARAARHELVHLMLRRAGARPPAWLEEGLADYYSTMELGSGRLRLGRAPAGHAQLLRDETWIGAARLLSLQPEDARGREAGLFYAQSWALVRWMMLEGGGAARVAAMLALVGAGRSQQAAFEETFGLPPDAALERARRITERIPPEAAPDVRAAAVNSAGIRILREPAPPPLADLLRAEALLDAGAEQEGQRLAEESARRHPDSAAAETLLGALALRRSAYETARAHLERAIALGGASARTYFEYAMLVRDTRGPAALVEESLRQAVAADPQFAEAWLVLGNWLLTQGRAREAAPCLEKATALDPQRSSAWEALGRALLEAGDRQRARAAAGRALSSAATGEQGEMARALIREIETQPAGPPKPAPAVETPAGWKPHEGDARVEGRLVWIGCDDVKLRFRIEVKPRTARTPAVTVLLETGKPNLVMLRGKTEGRREFVCGGQKPAPVVAAGYVSAPATPVQPAPESPAAAAERASPKAAKKAPAKRVSRRPARAKPVPEPVAGELVWLEFR